MSETTHDPKYPPVVMRGILGWGNRKVGLEPYGPGGRWGGEGRHASDGDLLGDALEREGCFEGGHLIVVCVPSRFDRAYADELEAHIRLLAAGLPT